MCSGKQTPEAENPIRRIFNPIWRGVIWGFFNQRVYHRRAARMLTITEREVIISKLNEELVAYEEAMDET